MIIVGSVGPNFRAASCTVAQADANNGVSGAGTSHARRPAAPPVRTGQPDGTASGSARHIAACVAAPPPPPITPNPPGGVYHAVGTEPFWDLTIDQRQMVFTDRGNNVAVAQPTPKVIIGFAGEIYQTPRLNVNIVHGTCSDGMSDRTYPDKVQVTADGHRYEGCGGL